MNARIWILLALLSTFMPTCAQANDGGLGQTIQIYTRFRSFIGKPVWLLIIRDLDHDVVIPYLYEIKSGNHFWVAFTFSRNYRITVSQLKFNPYKTKINNFCDIESGAIEGESLYITLNGDLSPDRNTFNCNVSRYADSNFTIAPQNQANPM